MRTRLILFLLCLIILIALVIMPYRTTLVRLTILGVTLLTWLSLLLLVFNRKILRAGFLGATAFFVIFLLLPISRKQDHDGLRDSFVRCLKQYEDVRYVYGGENHRGVDCSGLVRAAMVRSLIDHGIGSIDSSMIRSAFSLWWSDTNAIDLGQGARGATLTLGAGTPLPMRSAQDLQLGDLAVTTSGSHVLAYLGNQQWIEADPDVARVQIVDLTNSPKADQQVLLVRWRWLQ